MSVILHTHSVLSFILGLMAAGMLLHLIRVRQPIKAKGWLQSFYLGLVIWQMENVVRYSVPLEYIGSTAYKLQTIFILIPTLSITLISHAQFAYHFLVDTFEKERKTVLWISIIVSIGELLFVTWNELYNNSDMALMLESAFFYASLFTVWIITLCLRKAIHLRPTRKRSSKAHFVYAGINGCYVVGSLFSLLFGFFSEPGFWSYFLFVWLGNLASIVLYIVSAAIPANFQVKVTGFTFVLAATILTIITLTFYPPSQMNDMIVRRAQHDGLVKMIALSAGVALMIVTLMPFMLRISMTAPLQRLLEGVEKVNAGMLETKVRVGLRDEIGMLTENFNQMTQSLKKAQDELTGYTQNLEKKVARRTKQLQDSLNELKRTQAQLIQSEKMASLGELTAGIAHEIKNPLNFINNFSEVSMELCAELKEELAKENPDKENIMGLTQDISDNLKKINHHGNRAGGIITSMLEHSRASKGERQLININELVAEYLNTSYETMQLKDKNFTAQLDMDFDTAIEKINLIPQDFGRVLLNLFNNAFYAVGEKKKQVNGSYEPKISVHTKSSNDKIRISVKDNGIGIPGDIVDKIYQPFFTTKPTGVGTGLGLYLSYDIITKGYNGELKVNSTEGDGAEFIIYLPTKSA